MKPLISAVMCVYNGQDFLFQAIESILNQSFQEFELIIVNDGSVDKSIEIIKSFSDKRINLINTQNQGYAAASNIGIQFASSEFIAKCDDDDLALPDRFLHQYLHLTENPSCIAVGSWANWIDENGDFLYLMRVSADPDILKKGLPFKMPVPHAGSLYRKSALIEVGGYKNLGKYFFDEDTILMIDLARVGEFYNIQCPLSSFRITSSSNTQKAQPLVKIQREIILEYFRTGSINTSKSELFKIYDYKPSKRERRAYYYNRIGKLILLNEIPKISGLKHLIMSIFLCPVNLKYYKNLLSGIYLFLKNRFHLKIHDL